MKINNTIDIPETVKSVYQHKNLAMVLSALVSGFNFLLIIYSKNLYTASQNSFWDYKYTYIVAMMIILYLVEYRYRASAKKSQSYEQSINSIEFDFFKENYISLGLYLWMAMVTVLFLYDGYSDPLFLVLAVVASVLMFASFFSNYKSHRTYCQLNAQFDLAPPFSAVRVYWLMLSQTIMAILIAFGCSIYYSLPARLSPDLVVVAIPVILMGYQSVFTYLSFGYQSTLINPNEHNSLKDAKQIDQMKVQSIFMLATLVASLYIPVFYGYATHLIAYMQYVVTLVAMILCIITFVKCTLLLKRIYSIEE